MRVSYNGNTSAFQADARGSIPLTRSATPLRGFAGALLHIKYDLCLYIAK